MAQERKGLTESDSPFPCTNQKQHKYNPIQTKIPSLNKSGKEQKSNKYKSHHTFMELFNHFIVIKYRCDNYYN